MDELVQWFGEQLDIDALVAREATPGPWQNAPTARHHVTASGRSEEAVFASPPDVGAMVVAATGEASERPNLINAEFIAAHDPARVLREIKAKRQLLDDYEVTARIRDEAAARIKAAGDHPDSKDLETWDRAQREAAILEGPVKLAASPLSDRPGYREGWAP